MHLAIVTGASRGLGQALAESLLNDGARVIGMARGAMALSAHQNFTACPTDMANVVEAVALLEISLAKIEKQALTAVTLINNAGVVEPIALADNLPADAVASAVSINLAAPIALTSAFLRLTAQWRCQRRVLNISSGAASTAYQGWSVYGATKAGLDHFTRCVALEQQHADNPARIVSLAPGVIDTEMQTQIRATAEANFPNKQRFVDLKSKGELQTPEAAARRILSYLEHPDFGSEAVVDIRQL